MVNDILIGLFVGSFITYGLSNLLAYEEGPFGLFTALRTFIWNHWGKIDWVEKGISCPKCWGFWVALPLGIYIGYIANFNLIGIFLIWQTLSGVSIFLHSLKH